MEDYKITLCKTKECRIKGSCKRHISNNKTPERDHPVEDLYIKKRLCPFYISAINN